MPNLSRLIYVSDAANNQKDSDLSLFVERVRRENDQCGVTGLLVHGAGQFVQVLEGELDDVATRFDTIRADRRHKNIRRISFEFTSERLFSDRALGFVNADRNADDRVRFVEIARLARSTPNHDTSKRMLALLGVFKAQLLRIAQPTPQRAAG